MNAPKASPFQAGQVQSSGQTPDDEISLLDLLEVLVRQKNLVLSTMIVFAMLSAFYVLLNPLIPTYRTEIGFLMPKAIPLPKSVATKTTTEIENMINEAKVSFYQKFLMQIESYNFQREVFDRGKFLEKFVDSANGSVSSDEVVMGINKSITLKDVPAKKNEMFNKPIFLEAEGLKPEAMKEFFNALVETAIKNIDMRDYLVDAIDRRLETILNKKELLFSQEKKKQSDKIELLTKEFNLARSLNIKENNFKSEHLHGAPKWYLYGERILEQELKILKSRLGSGDIVKLGSGDIVKRVKLDMDLKRWESAKATLKSPSVVAISQSAISTIQPSKSTKAPIIIAGMVAGLLFGIIIAFIRDGIRNLRERENLLSASRNNSKQFVFEHSPQSTTFSS